jgi:hypothetical protein
MTPGGPGSFEKADRGSAHEPSADLLVTVKLQDEVSELVEFARSLKRGRDSETAAIQRVRDEMANVQKEMADPSSYGSVYTDWVADIDGAVAALDALLQARK